MPSNVSDPYTQPLYAEAVSYVGPLTPQRLHTAVEFFRGWMSIIIRFFSSKWLEANTNRLNFVQRFSTVTT
ncbi:MAG: hypothetical protein R6V56_00320, partial [Lentisphaeria bacterium]